MFTGIITELGRLDRTTPHGGGRRLAILAPQTASGLEPGGSVSINGCCLSAEECGAERFQLYCTPETQERSTLGSLRPGAGVNLELPLRPGDRLGGHFVQGHVDGVGEVVEVREAGGSWIFAFRAPAAVARYLVEKGSVAVEGISLTVAAIRGEVFEVAVIPETWNRTNLSAARPGAKVNLEADILAKYVERLLGRSREDRFAETLHEFLGE